MYEKTNWIDKETPVSAANMNKMEDGIFDAHASAMRLNDFDNFVLYGPDAPTKIYPTDAGHIIVTGPPASYTLEVQNAPNNSAKKYIIRSNLAQSTAKLTIAFADGGTSYTLRTGDTLYAITKTIDGVSSHSGFVVNGFHSSSQLPTLRFDGSTSGISYANRSAIITRIGNLVNVNMNIQLSSKGSVQGPAEISLPYKSDGVLQNISIDYYNYLSVPSNPVILIPPGSLTGYLVTVPGSGPGTPHDIVHSDHFAHNTLLSISGFYYCE